MRNDNAAALTRLNDRLVDLLAQADIAAERTAHAVALGGGDVQVAVTAIFENPYEKVDGELRVCGVEIAIHSPALLGEDAWEYSYGRGLDDEAGLTAALANWVRFDAPVLVAPGSDVPGDCVVMEMARNAVNGIAPGTWRIYAGPLSYVAGEKGEQPCCNACLFTMSLPWLLPLMKAPVSFALKLVATKDEDGTTGADCRRNGADVPDAIEGIAGAAESWPAGDGVQMRRQYLYFKAPSRLDA